MSFHGIVGNQAVIEALAAEVARRPYHAYLLIGPASIGKGMVAQALAHGILCERSPGTNFCCTPENCAVRKMPAGSAGARGGPPLARCDCCAACVQVATGVHPDFIYVARLPKRSEVLIEQVRDFIERLGLRPSRGSRRVAIIDDAETLNIPAQNALLKTIEEPPAHTVIFIVTRSERALLDTMRSRMRPIRFGPLAAAEIEAVLTSHTGMTRERAAGLARLARGHLARAFALAEGADAPMAELLKGLTGASTLDFVEAHRLSQQFFGTRDDASNNFELIARMLEEMLCCKLLQAELNAPSPEVARMMSQFAHEIDTARLAELLQLVLDAHAAVDAMANPRLQAENWWMAAGAALRGR
jgi:DNA polymerase III delta prime subunit